MFLSRKKKQADRTTNVQYDVNEAEAEAIMKMWDIIAQIIKRMTENHKMVIVAVIVNRPIVLYEFIRKYHRLQLRYD